MDPQLIDFLKANRITVVSILRPDGSPHAATVHYSMQDEPLRFYISTNRKSRKAENLLDSKSVPAAFVIGFSEEEWKTCQMNGTIRMISDINELKKIQEIHYAMHPKAEQFKDNPDTIFLEFTPGWWRYSDFKTSPPTIITG